MRCLPDNPGALTSLPTNQLSGAGQYSEIVTPCSHAPRERLLGTCSTRGRGWVGAGPRPAPPVGAIAAYTRTREGAALALDATTPKTSIPAMNAQVRRRGVVSERAIRTRRLSGRRRPFSRRG